jgi:hypothetical protein
LAESRVQSAAAPALVIRHFFYSSFLFIAVLAGFEHQTVASLLSDQQAASGFSTLFRPEGCGPAEPLPDLSHKAAITAAEAKEKTMKLMTVFELAAKSASERQAIFQEASAEAANTRLTEDERRFAEFTLVNLTRAAQPAIR